MAQQQSRAQSCPKPSADSLFEGGGGGGNGRNSPPLPRQTMGTVTATHRCTRSAHGRCPGVPPETPPSCCGSCSDRAYRTVQGSRPKVDYDDCHERQRATPAAASTPASGLSLLVASPPQHGCRLRHDEQNLFEDAPLLLYRQHEELMVDRRWQGVDRGQSDGDTAGNGGTVNTAPPPCVGIYQEHSINRFTASCPLPWGHDGIEHDHWTSRLTVSYGGNGGFEHRRLGRIASGSGRLPPIGAPASNGGGGNGGGVSPVMLPPSTARPAPSNPHQWLESFNLRRSRSGASGSEDAAGLESPPPVLPLLSNPRVSIAGGGVTSVAAGEAGSPGLADSLLPQAEGRVVAVGTCPAADCPTNGDCLSGATLEMLVYEVNFKRATRTFLPGESSNQRSISCGTLVIVSA